MVAAFASDAIVIWSPNFRFSLYFSLLNAETGSQQTASSAMQSVSNVIYGRAFPVSFPPLFMDCFSLVWLPGLTPSGLNRPPMADISARARTRSVKELTYWHGITALH